MPLRVSALRSLGAYMNIFSIESFMHELAQASETDPIDFRLRQLDDPRARDVITAAAERFGWSRFPRKQGSGRGFAFARYKNLGAYAAVAVEVSLDHESGRVRLVRAAASVDSGQAVNPDGIRNKIEGAFPNLRVGRFTKASPSTGRASRAAIGAAIRSFAFRRCRIRLRSM
jgi:CO/xanthine dehydrogenase Mo-binding subunit